MELFKQVVVKECKVDNEDVYGITDGWRWFQYAYTIKEHAQSMLKHFKSEVIITLNIKYLEPKQIVRD